LTTFVIIVKKFLKSTPPHQFRREKVTFVLNIGKTQKINRNSYCENCREGQMVKSQSNKTLFSLVDAKIESKGQRWKNLVSVGYNYYWVS